MRITKRQLKRIIQEEKLRMEACGEMDDLAMSTMGAGPEVVDVVNTVSESQSPEGELVMEMEMASRNLELALESINSAAALCPRCIEEVAVAAPLMEALESQAIALHETLDAVGTVVAESAGLEGLAAGNEEVVASVELGETDY